MFKQIVDIGQKYTDIAMVMGMLYRSEINIHISTLWDGRYDVKLGDEHNGFVAEDNVKTFSACVNFLDIQAQIHFPTSLYARWCKGENPDEVEKDMAGA